MQVEDLELGYGQNICIPDDGSTRLWYWDTGYALAGWCTYSAFWSCHGADFPCYLSSHTFLLELQYSFSCHYVLEEYKLNFFIDFFYSKEIVLSIRIGWQNLGFWSIWVLLRFLSLRRCHNVFIETLLYEMNMRLWGPMEYCNTELEKVSWSSVFTLLSFVTLYALWEIVHR